MVATSLPDTINKSTLQFHQHRGLCSPFCNQCKWQIVPETQDQCWRDHVAAIPGSASAYEVVTISISNPVRRRTVPTAANRMFWHPRLITRMAWRAEWACPIASHRPGRALADPCPGPWPCWQGDGHSSPSLPVPACTCFRNYVMSVME